MKVIGGFLLLAGAAIMCAAIMLLGESSTRSAFMVAGLLVELLGLGLQIQAYRSGPGSRG